MTARLPPGLSFWNPAALIATWGGSGLLPGPSGTWGSLATLPFAWLVAVQWGSAWLIVAAAAAFGIGCWASAAFLRHSDDKDPGAIVVDETAGQLLALAAVPPEPLWYLAGFLLFRIADIVKPWPASWADRKLSGALGVMADDIFAGAYVLLALYLARLTIGG